MFAEGPALMKGIRNHHPLNSVYLLKSGVHSVKANIKIDTHLWTKLPYTVVTTQVKYSMAWDSPSPN